MDGQIVANRMVSNVMYGHDIYGCHIQVGGVDYDQDSGTQYVPGDIIVKDGDNNTICKFDVTGAMVNGDIRARDPVTNKFIRINEGVIESGIGTDVYGTYEASSAYAGGGHGLGVNTENFAITAEHVLHDWGDGLYQLGGGRLRYVSDINSDGTPVFSEIEFKNGFMINDLT